MKSSESMIHPLRKLAGKTSLSILLMLIASCGTTANPHPSTPDQPQGSPIYFAPYVAGTSHLVYNSGFPPVPVPQEVTFPQIYDIEDTAKTFSQTAYYGESITPQAVNTGKITVAQRGLLNLQIQTSYVENSGAIPPNFTPVNNNPPKPGFAVELAGQTGGLVQFVGQAVTPLVAATQCPSQKTAQTFLFITIPGPISTALDGTGWNPKTDTAYGSVDISAKGTAVTFQNINQFTLGSGKPDQPAASSHTGACGSTSFGYLTGVPAQVVLTDPQQGASLTAPPQASIGINPAGLLVEDNGSWATTSLPNTNPPLLYNNVLGAGTGAVGLLKPSSPVDTKAIVGAQYLGFIYSSGIYSSGQPPIGLTSHLASFGFPGAPTLPSKCSPFVAQTGPLVNGIYGGDYQQTNGQDDPSTSSDGFGNCDFAIDLGSPSDSNNSLYTQATVWVGSGYATNPSSPTYFFHAVAIAGQINGKDAIFLIGFDPVTTQPWGIYLLQSN